MGSSFLIVSWWWHAYGTVGNIIAQAEFSGTKREFENSVGISTEEQGLQSLR
jgi:hypothetical protein